MKSIVVLGSTGSIGVSTLDLARRFPQEFKVRGLVAGRNLKLLAAQVKEFDPEWISIREEEGVAKNSPRETFAVVKLLVDNWRWQGVPYYLRSGKRMCRKVTEIAIQFKKAPQLLFKAAASPNMEDEIRPNILVLRIQPDEGITLQFEAKHPGMLIRTRPVEMEFRFETSFGALRSPTAYENLLLDCLSGDQTLFNRADEVEAAWSLMMPLLEAWESKRPLDFPNYKAGSWGPQVADEMIGRDGFSWRTPA